MFTVLLRGLEIYAHHGVSDHERRTGHRYIIDLELLVDGKADETDAIFDTVDYGAVGAEVSKLVTDSQFRTVERLARLIADRLLQNHQSIREVTLEVRKRLPPAPIIAAESGVRLHVTR